MEVYSGMMRRNRFAILLLLLVVVTATIPALDFADIYYYFGDDSFYSLENSGRTIFPTLVIPSGGEFEGMGQAYTAVARDASFFDANAAASSSLEYTELTFVHNNWIADTSIEGVLYTHRTGDLGLAVGGKFLHLPFTQYDGLSRQVASGRYSEGTVGVNASYNFLRNFDFPGVAVGATVKTVYRYIPEQIAANQSAIAFAADVGVLSRFDFLKAYSSRTPNFAVGIAARNMGLPVRGEPLPTQLTTGIAYSPIRPLVLAADAIVPLSFAPGIGAPLPGGAFGASIRVTPFFTLQSGFLMLWNGFRLSLGSTLDLTDFSVDINYNLDQGTQPQGLERFSIQARLSFGDQGRAALRDLVDRYYLEAWQASALGDIETAIEYTRRALELDPTFTPAEELLAVSLDTRQLQQDLRAIDLESIGDSLGTED